MDNKNNFDVTSIKEIYSGSVQITNLQKELGTKGALLVVRGDKAYEDILENKQLSNPKFWLYENLLSSERIKKELEKNPHHKLFDGTGFSALEALCWHSKNINRKAVIVMAKEFIPQLSKRHNVDIIHGDLPGEEGYVKKQREVLKSRNDIIPLHQALYGAKALAPIGNNVVEQLNDMNIKLDASLWCIASGSSLYGIGGKIKQYFQNVETYVVEPNTNITVPFNLNLKNKDEVRDYAKSIIKNYSLDDWVKDGKNYSGVFPLHAKHPSTYLLLDWYKTGDVKFDNLLHLSTSEVNKTRKLIAEINSDYNWTKTTALTLNPAIKMARKGKNVLVMAYGKHKEEAYRSINIK